MGSSGSSELTKMRGRDTGFVWVTLRERFLVSRWESSGFLSERASRVGVRGSSGLEKMGSRLGERKWEEREREREREREE